MLRLSQLAAVNQLLVVNVAAPLALGTFVGFSFLSLTSLYYILDLNATFVTISNSSESSLVIFDLQPAHFLLDTYYLGLHLVDVYLFPFIYIFILITLLSILFCLAYNIHELMSFMLYCTIILLAGYLLFFTSSMILFFFAYEMLLVPSFFILYNFAKTRRCVEAAYLMFF